MRPIIVAAAVALIIGVLGGTITDTGAWYEALNKPSWQPPDWLFGPVWTTIYALCVIAAAHAWNRAPDGTIRSWIIAGFALNGFFNLAWSLLFFRLQRPDWALLEVGLLWLSILMLIVLFARFAPRASLLLVPYLAWVSFAAWLNLTIVRLNGPFG